MKTKLFILVLALQSAWVVGTALTQEHILRVGQVVMLETRPVDPRDLLKGDYIRLGYKIGDVPRNRFEPPWQGDVNPGTAVYVALKPGTNGFFQVGRAGREWFEPAGNEVVIRGSIGDSWRNSLESLHVDYGLEEYYVPEGQGTPQGKLTVQAAVDKDGHGRIKQVYVDGVPFAQAMRVKQP